MHRTVNATPQTRWFKSSPLHQLYSGSKLMSISVFKRWVVETRCSIHCGPTKFMKIIMQLIFSPPLVSKDKCVFGHQDLVRSYLTTQQIYIGERDIEVSYNDFHHIWDISVFKFCKNAAGCGTKESRDKTWQEIVEKLKLLFPDSRFDHTWRWVHAHSCYTDAQDVDCIPGVRFFVKANTVTSKLD